MCIALRRSTGIVITSYSIHYTKLYDDKLGHLAQGFIPTMAAREILIRKSIVRGKGWLAFILICIASFITASYELIEWAAALLMGQGSDEFLGTQGYVWDTQSDMFFAMTSYNFV